jgi:hypothetical protein
MGENARVSNPYAPPGDRPRQPDGDRTGAPAPDQPGQPVPPQHPPYPVGPHAQASWPPHAVAVPRPPEQVPTDPDGAARATRLARLFGLLVLSSVLVSTTRIPLRAVAVVFVLAAIGVGIVALVVAGRAHVRGALPVVLGTGLAVAVVWTLFMGAAIAFWGPERDRQECRDGALTLSAQAVCDAQYRQDMDELSDRLQRRG